MDVVTPDSLVKEGAELMPLEIVEEFQTLWGKYVRDRKGSTEVLRYLTAEGFFSAPASTKYHGAFPGGLCKHSVTVANETYRRSAVMCALLHDICKIDAYKKTTKRQRGADGKWQDVPAYEYNDSALPLGHGEKSVFLLLSLGMELTDQEAAAIRWHMGAYRDRECFNEMGRAFDRYPLALFLHLADMTAAHWDKV